MASTLVGAFLLMYICGIQKTTNYEMGIFTKGNTTQNA